MPPAKGRRGRLGMRVSCAIPKEAAIANQVVQSGP